MNFIATFIYNEVTRHGATPETASVEVGEQISAAFANNLISNLQKIGYGVNIPTQIAGQNATAALGNSIVSEAKRAYEHVIWVS